MRSTARYLAAGLVLSIVSVNALQTTWQQCGGIGWTGGTECIPGTTCTFANYWYSQCLPNPTTITTVKPSTTTSGITIFWDTPLPTPLSTTTTILDHTAWDTTIPVPPSTTTTILDHTTPTTYPYMHTPITTRASTLPPLAVA